MASLAGKIQSGILTYRSHRRWAVDQRLPTTATRIRLNLDGCGLSCAAEDQRLKCCSFHPSTDHLRPLLHKRWPKKQDKVLDLISKFHVRTPPSLSFQRIQSRRQQVCASVAAAKAMVATSASPGLVLQRPGLIDTAPAKGRLPAVPTAFPEAYTSRNWPLLWPSRGTAAPHPPLQRTAPQAPAENDRRRSIVRAAPRAPAADLSRAAQMARLSQLVYHPDPRARLEALGLELKECKQTPYTAFFVADGPADLFGGGLEREGNSQAEGKTRYIITRGVAFDREEVKWTDLWTKLLHFWPVEFERGLTPRGMDLLVHSGVQEIAETVYSALLPFLAFDPKRDGISAVQFGGHSLGGSLAVLLMLMFHLRSPIRKGWSADVEFNSHSFGSFPVLATPIQLPWNGANDSQQGAGSSDVRSSTCPCALMKAIESLRSQLSSSRNESTEQSCSVLSSLGLQDTTSQSFVLDSDIVPRAFLALKQDTIRGMWGLKEKLMGSSRSSDWSEHPLHFHQVGLVNFMVGEEASVARLHATLAEEALHVDIADFLRDPSLLGKSIQDHCFNQYVSKLESAAAAARL